MAAGNDVTSIGHHHRWKEPLIMSTDTNSALRSAMKRVESFLAQRNIRPKKSMILELCTNVLGYKSSNEMSALAREHNLHIPQIFPHKTIQLGHCLANTCNMYRNSDGLNIAIPYNKNPIIMTDTTGRIVQYMPNTGVIHTPHARYPIMDVAFIVDFAQHANCFEVRMDIGNDEPTNEWSEWDGEDNIPVRFNHIDDAVDALNAYLKTIQDARKYGRMDSDPTQTWQIYSIHAIQHQNGKDISMDMGYTGPHRPA